MVADGDGAGAEDMNINWSGVESVGRGYGCCRIAACFGYCLNIDWWVSRTYIYISSSVVFSFAIEGQRAIHLITIYAYIHEIKWLSALMSWTFDLHEMAYYLLQLLLYIRKITAYIYKVRVLLLNMYVFYLLLLWLVITDGVALVEELVDWWL